MKITFKPLTYSLLFICLFSAAANAQIHVPDSLRVSVNGDFMLTRKSNFGTGVDAPSGVDPVAAFKYGAGIALQVDVPVKYEWLYVTASAGFDNYFTDGSAVYAQSSIKNIRTPNFQTIPLKVGVKVFWGNRLYFQGEVGETLLLNKDSFYAPYSSALTWSPQVGMIFPLKKRHTYIDAGIRYENFASFYNNSSYSEFFAFHLAYSFNL